MNFVSFSFVLFLLMTLLLFYTLPARGRKPLLLGMSYLFYASWNVPFILLILGSTSLDYWMSQIIAKSQKPWVRRGALTLGLLVNLGILVYYKYANFLLDSAYGLLQFLHQPVQAPPVLHILLPLGISFYTFEAISYMVDVYRGKAPARNWLDYNFYIMFFPHLISGPIIRFCELWPQYKQPLQLPGLARIAQGVQLILLGYLFKVMIADPVAAMADPVFTHPEAGGVLATYLGILAFTVQIYFDFMGYTHIARGVSLLFNIELPLNFNHPYLATNISNFWERWHISLSRWIRDYLYFPLGGSKGLLGRTLFNLLLTMLICGAWHGAGWTYIAWGAYHGLLLGGYHLFKTGAKGIDHSGLNRLRAHPFYQAAGVGLTFACVALGWVLFRSKDLGSASLILTRLFQVPALLSELGKPSHWDEVAGIAGMLALCFVGPLAMRWVRGLYLPLPFWVKVQTACVLALLCWLLTAEGTVPFIYFQF
ncbi:MBOAT family protein [Vampirovibrio sp.]|uniref:MBOAT family O-acyltransferase n=1 Tax=Vampirovibrio sp. TaxID=2717857 RepID=UPI00359427E0